jgi:oxygen-independent coproporphyrinogen-3 oxidase
MCETYVDTVLNEYRLGLKKTYSHLAGEPVYTVFIGGGTPSLLPIDLMDRLINGLKTAGDFRANELSEFTIECNPETVTYSYLEGLKKLGVTRLSFGMQSAVPRILAILDRKHTPGQTEQVCEWASSLGFEFSLDLIYGAPTETLEEWGVSVAESVRLASVYGGCRGGSDAGSDGGSVGSGAALRAGSDDALDANSVANSGGLNHISCYALTLEKSVPLYKRVDEIDVDLQSSKYELADKLLTEAGFEWYEISNWARVAGASVRESSDDFRSLHNLAYWENREYIGLGVSAHSHIIAGASTINKRFWNPKSLPKYTALVTSGESPEYEILTTDEQQIEEVFLAARMPSFSSYLSSLGDGANDLIAELLTDGFIDSDLKLTMTGRLLNDTVIQKVLDFLDSSENGSVDDIGNDKVSSVCPHFQKMTCRSCPVCIMS